MRKILVRIGVGLVLLFVVIIVGQAIHQHLEQSAIRKTADKFETYVLAGNGQASYAMLTSATQSSLNLGVWEIQNANLSGFFYKQKPVYESSTSKSGVQTITYGIEGLDGSYTLAVLVVKADNAWRVQQFTSTLNS